SDVRDEEKAQEKLDSPNITRQLKLYSISYEKVFGKPLDEVGIYFFESRITAFKKFRPDTLKKYEEQVLDVAEDIRRGNFDATASSFTCSMCMFYNICPFSKADVLF
ncbi:MAG: PD-(D/E)XK nuclease family protein, partial [Spirochaetia bacterium]|nr:PD-(D/E)XK nuclease family protein [Spirochaetia bacterium]